MDVLYSRRKYVLSKSGIIFIKDNFSRKNLGNKLNCNIQFSHPKILLLN